MVVVSIALLTLGLAALPAEAQDGSITGTVIDANTLAPINNANVQVYSSTGSFLKSSSTDVTGFYTLGAMSPGSYFVRTSLFGTLNYVDKLYDNITCSPCTVTTGTPVVVTAGTIRSGVNFALVPGGSITGTVTDSNTAAPLFNANVQVLSSTGTFLKSVSTDVAGFFTLTGLPAASYLVRTSLASTLNYVDEVYDNVTCAPCVVTTGTLVVVAVGTTRAGVNFALAPGGALTGTVIDAVTLAPINNINVQIFNSANALVKNLSTGSGGTGVITAAGLLAGSYFARITNQGTYIDQLYDHLPCQGCTATTGTPIVVAVGATRGGVNFTLVQGGLVTGTVTDAGTAAALNNANVQVYNSTGVFIKSANTNSAGFFTLSGLPAASYFVRTQLSGGLNYVDELYDNIPCAPCTVTTGTPVVVTAGNTRAGVDFALTPGGTITGTVTDAGTAAPVNNANVQVYSSTGNFLKSSNTNGTGFFTLAGLPAASYFVKTSLSGGPNYIDEVYDNIPCAPCNVTIGTPVIVTAGTTRPGVDFALAQGATITGTVTDAGTAAPLNGVNVQLYSSTGNFVKGINTNGTGFFTLAGMQAGSYFVRTSVSGGLNYIDEVYDNIPCAPCDVTTGTPIVVTAGMTRSGVDFALAQGGGISGTVTDAATTTPLSGVTVQVIGSTGGAVLRSGTTNGSGVFTVSGLQAGSYFARTVVLSSQNYVDEIYDNRIAAGTIITSGTPIAVTAGATHNGVDFALDQGGIITGTVTDAGTTALLVGISVQVLNARGLALKSVNTDGSGSFMLTGLPAGSYFVRTRDSVNYADELYDNIPFVVGDVTATGTPVAVTAGATHAGVDFALAPGGTVTGTVRDAATSAPLGGVPVRLLDATGAEVRSATTAGNGTFTMSGLAAGTYYAHTDNEIGYIDVLYGGQQCLLACKLQRNMPAGTPIAVTAGTTTGPIDFALTAGGRIAGRLSDAGTTGPVTGASVLLYAASGALVAYGGPDNAGDYLTGSGVPTGTYYARTFNVQGYVDQIHAGLTLCFPSCLPTSGTPIALTEGVTTGNINFALTAGTELIQNGDFSNGWTNWVQFATPDMSYMPSQVNNETFVFSRVPPPPGTANQAVVFQNTGAALAAGTNLMSTFFIGNNSQVRKRISVLLHDSDFSDLTVCTFWVPPSGSDTWPYAMRTHTTKAWTNATISFYAASTNVPAGAYIVDDVSLHAVPGPVTERVDCFDVFTPAAPGGPDGADMLVNGNFNTGTLAPWGTFGTITHQIVGGVFEFIKPNGTPPAGVVLQITGQALPRNEILTATFELGNSSAVRKRVTVILHDNNFSDLTACTFWLAPNQPLSPYTYRAFTTKAWTNATLSVYPATTGAQEWIRLDNATLRRTPGALIVGTECIGPSAGGLASTSSVSGSSGPAPTTSTTPATTTGSVPSVAASDGWIADGFARASDAASAGAGSSWIATARSATVTSLQLAAPLDLTNAREAHLRFQSLSSDASGAAVQVSTNGVDWFTVRTLDASDDWMPVDIDLADYLGEMILVRFVFETVAPGDSLVPAFWRIGDVKIERR
jgi:hypothetical protein